LAIRINSLRTRDGLTDLLALADAHLRPAIIFVPMVESVMEIEIAAAILPDVAFVPLIETVRGLRAADGIAALPAVAMLMFGGGDFSAELGVALAWEPLLAARSALVMACAGAGKPAMDVPFIAIDDTAGLATECVRAKALGFAAKAAIHPAQIEIINTHWRPTADELAEAAAAQRAFLAAKGAPVRFKGKMLEAPLMRRYRQTLSLEGKSHA
jgi:citrate lyase beta subunit